MYNVADVRMLPLIWRECTWEPKITITGHDCAPGGSIKNLENNAMKHKKRSHSPQGTMKALIIYDDVDCAERAIEFLRRAASQAGMHVQWEIKPRRVSVLRLPTAAEEALLEAVGAATQSSLPIFEASVAELAQRLAEALGRSPSARRASACCHMCQPYHQAQRDQQ
jgi:hypothetical protein